ncbi:MAG: DNA-binding protein [Proteobacteria bacterium]|jgi:antitoxin FitA|nr:DNA-binding protein [Pseudomonadota bacterium]
MGQLIVRNIEDDIVRALKRRAAKQGRSAEAEHREILREVLKEEQTRPSFKEFLLSMPNVGRDEDFRAPRDLPRKVEL